MLTTMDTYTLWRYVQEVEKIQDGESLPWDWWYFRRWLARSPMSRLKGRVNSEGDMYYVDRYGYKRNGDIYEVDERCIGVICMVVILVSGGIPITVTARKAGVSEERVRGILKNYKYYVGWHNAYLPDGRRIWPAIKEVELLHRDVVSERLT